MSPAFCVWCTADISQFEIIVALKEAGGDKAEKGDKGDDARRRFKIVFSLANVIDLNTITEFCSKVPQTEKTKEIVVS